MAKRRRFIRVEGVEAVIQSLREHVRKLIGGRSLNPISNEALPEATVGYSAPYAIYVHENLEARHPNGGQAKFLEAAARTLMPYLRVQIEADLKRGLSLRDAIKRAAETLKKASQKLVPIDTGFLHDSAFVKMDN